MKREGQIIKISAKGEKQNECKQGRRRGNVLNFRSERAEETVDCTGALLGRDWIRDVVDVLAENILSLLRLVNGIV